MMARLLASTALSGGMLIAFSIPLAAQTPLPPIEVRAQERNAQLRRQVWHQAAIDLGEGIVG